MEDICPNLGMALGKECPLYVVHNSHRRSTISISDYSIPFVQRIPKTYQCCSTSSDCSLQFLTLCAQLQWTDWRLLKAYIWMILPLLSGPNQTPKLHVRCIIATQLSIKPYTLSQTTCIQIEVNRKTYNNSQSPKQI